MKYLKHLSIFTFLLFIFFFWLITYWSFQPNIISFENPDSLQIDKQEYRPWDRIIYTMTYCKKYRLVWLVDRSLVDWYRITYNQITSDLPEWCHTVKSADLVVPSFASASTYYLDISAEYKLNPIKTQKVNLKTQPFKVIK